MEQVRLSSSKMCTQGKNQGEEKKPRRGECQGHFSYKFSGCDSHRESVDEGRNEIRTGKPLPRAGRIYGFWEINSSSSFESTASLISEIVLSRLRRLVLGLVMVVPRLAVLL